MFDTPVLPRLGTILAEVSSGDLAIPVFQRPFVWDDDRRLSLLDSIAEGMPIGSLLVWRTTNRELRTYPQVGGVIIARPSRNSEKIGYLIDGHQRISTLFGALHTGDSDLADDETRWPLYYELGATSRPAFRVPPRRGTIPGNWLPLNTLLDGDRLFDFTQQLREEGRKELAKEAERLANIFRDYVIPIVPLVTEELDIVTDAFVRINSQGKGMSEAHMLRALTHLGTIDTEEHFSKVRQNLEPLGWGKLDDQVLVNILKAQLDLDVYASDIRGLRDRLKADPAPLKALTSVLVEAVEFLAVEIGVRGPKALPYTYQIVTVATLAAWSPGILRKPECQGLLRLWFWITTYTEHFSGITGSTIRGGIHQLHDALQLSAEWPFKEPPPVEPLTRLRGSTGRSQAFLLFLARLPKDSSARQRRLERLETEDTRSLIAEVSSGAPGNRVIASPAELKELRTAIKLRQISDELADEYGIPGEALAAIHDPLEFVNERTRFLLAKERGFIENWGLTMGDPEN